MDILFKNTHTRTKELTKEMYRYFYFQRTSTIVVFVLLSLSFLANAVSGILGYSYSIVVLVGVPLLILSRIFFCAYQVNTMRKRDREMSEQDIEVETMVTNEYVQNTALGSTAKIGLDKIKYATRTKNLILLHTKANLIYIFRKDTFTVGSYDQFMAFLKSKGIKVKGK